MLNKMDTKRHYKMYKKGKHWIFAGIIAVGLSLGAVDVSANADVVANDGATSTVVTTAESVKRDTVTPTPKVDPGPKVDPEPVTAPVDKPDATPVPKDDGSKVAEEPVTNPAPQPVRSSRSLAPAAVPVVKESINDWLPNKTLQLTIMNRLNEMDLGRTWTTPEEITQDDMALLDEVHVGGSSNSGNKDTYIDGTTSFSLKGLEYAINVKHLTLKSNLNAGYHYFGDVTDISELAYMAKLETVDLAGNRITDASPLWGLKNLQDLDIQYNHILDLSGFKAMHIPKIKTWFQYVVLPLTRVDRATRQGRLAVKFTDEDDYTWKLSTAKEAWWVSTESKIPGQTYGLVYYKGGDKTYNPDGSITFDNMPEQEPGVTSYKDKLVIPQQYKYFMIGVANENGTNRIVIVQPYLLSDKAGTVTVSYQDKDGKPLADDEILDAKLVGDSYTTAAKEFDGYTLTKAPENANGTYTADDIHVVYVYDKTPVTPPVVTPSATIKVTVHYQTSDGIPVAADVVLTGKAGDSYTTSAAVVDGYTLATTPANANGVYGDQDSEVTYIYAKDEGDANLIDPGNEADKPDGKKPDVNKPVTPSTGGAAAVVAKSNPNGGHVVNLTVGKTAAKETLPQTDEKTISPLWGLAVLGSLLGLAVIGRKQKF
ncbi:MucBP domain-containing protein [Levilactobacillus tangyuanensis]|uniref:MucBP domain-containing protein n=1 Tax=Levilactobacillus tangyuanensis TaxID=2486021 RepID=A0ABW1TJZ9_9LACO|nr:MucBP domain-containing protein [Levilactobacillus tangyuanensis]